MSNFGLSCDVCNRENIGVTWVNGMKFCAKCYQETFNNGNKFMEQNLNNMYDFYLRILNEKDQQIAILEKALELACQHIWALSVWENSEEEVIKDNVEYFKTRVKEMMKSE